MHDGNRALITINDKIIDTNTDEVGTFSDGSGRGIHVVVISSKGEIVLKKCYNTVLTNWNTIDDELPKYRKNNGYMVIAAVKENAIKEDFKIPSTIRGMFTYMGSKRIGELQPFQSWAFIGTIGNDTCWE